MTSGLLAIAMAIMTRCTHSAGEFVGVGVGEAFRVGDADPAEEGDYAVFDLGAGESGLVEAEGFCQVEADGVDGGEGG